MIYLLHAVGTSRYKIGYTAGTLQERIATLQTGCPFPIRALAAYDGDYIEECRMQDVYADYCVQGEWFEFTNEVLNYVLHRFIAQKPLSPALLQDRGTSREPYQKAHELWNVLMQIRWKRAGYGHRPSDPFRATKSQMAIHSEWIKRAASLPEPFENLPEGTLNELVELVEQIDY